MNKKQPKRTRNEGLFIRVTEDEKKRIESNAKKLGMKVSEFLRHLLAKELR